MNNDMEVILIALMTAFVWGTTIFLVLVRHFDNQQTILRYNFWITFLMVVNIMVCLPALFLVNQQELSWLGNLAWLLSFGTDTLITAGLVIFILISWSWHYQRLPVNFDFLVVLGAGLNKGRVPPVLAARLERAYLLWHSNSTAKVIVTGGRVHQDKISEAVAMAAYLRKRGIPSKQIICEEAALNTWQNLRNCAKIINKKWTGAAMPQVVVVTSSFHVLRAKSYGHRLGLHFNFTGAPTPWPYLPLTTIRDYLGNIRDHCYFATMILLIVLLIIGVILY